MRTIDDLKKNGFTVYTWQKIIRSDFGIKPKGICTGEFNFITKWNKLYISGGIFGKKKYRVRNPVEVYFAATKQYPNIHIQLKDYEFYITNATIGN